jgi:acyl carrier protein
MRELFFYKEEEMQNIYKVMDEVAYVCQITVGKDIDKQSYDTPLSDYGLDSLDYMDLLYNIEERFDKKIKMDAKKAQKLTINSIAQMVVASE